MTPLEYEYLRKLLKERSGLDLSADKQYLVESRLIPLARKASLNGIAELVQKINDLYRALGQITARAVLALGAAESVVGITDAFKPYPERRGLYRPNPARGARPALKMVAAAG